MLYIIMYTVYGAARLWVKVVIGRVFMAVNLAWVLKIIIPAHNKSHLAHVLACTAYFAADKVIYYCS